MSTIGPTAVGDGASQGTQGSPRTPGTGRTRGNPSRGEPEGAPARSKAMEIQGFRGIAALSTVIFHVWQQYIAYDAFGPHNPVTNRYAGSLISLEVIDLFFVMSAYLLTLTYARAAIDGGSVRSARSFLFRRAIRIVPLYVLAVLLVWATRNPTLPGNWLDLVEHLTFTHIFDRRQIFYTLGPAWSLSLEIVFYLVLVSVGPLVVRLCRRVDRRGGRIAVFAGVCLLLFALPLVWIAVARYGYGVPHTDWPVYFGPQSRFGGFAAGMGLAVLMVALGPRGRLSARWSVTLTVVAVAAAYYLSLDSAPENFTFTFYHPLTSLTWALLLFSTIHAAERVRWHAVLRSRVLTYVGLISYSLFIWHEPVMLQLYKSGLLPDGPAGYPLGTLIVLLVAVPFAVASYWFLEYPSSLLAGLKDAKGEPREFYPGPAPLAEARMEAVR